MAKRIIKQPQIDPEIMRLLGDYFMGKHDVLLSFLFGSYVSKKMNALVILISAYYSVNIRESMQLMISKKI